MYIKDTWLLVRYTRDKKKVLVNLYWLLKERYYMIVISDIYLNKEIELSNGNIIISDGVGLNIIDCTKRYTTRLKFIGIDAMISENVCYFTWRYATPKNTDSGISISTDLDSEVDKINNRMSLIGADTTVCTDGIQILKRASTVKNKDSIEQNTIYTDTCEVKEDIKCKVTDGGFVNINLIKCCTCKLEADGPVNLRFIDGSSYIEVTADDKIYCDSLFRAMITQDIITRTKRIIDCCYEDDNTEEHSIYLDFSNLDLVDRFRLHDKYNKIRSITLDFKGKYVIMEQFAIKFICREDMNITIKYSNREMQRVLEILFGEQKNCKIIYTGE